MTYQAQAATSQTGMDSGGVEMTRRYDIDALRIFAFAVLILYHCGMFYVADWGWHVKSAHQSEGLQALMLLTNQWRMGLLFLISGMAASFMLARYTPGQFAWSRVKRLFLPLIFGMLVIVAPQAYFQGTANGAFDYSFLDFYGRYLTMQPWPENAFDGWKDGWTWNHLWYLPYVLAYSLVMAAVSPLMNSRAGAVVLEKLRHCGPVVILVVPCLLLFVSAILLRRDHPQTHNFHADWYLHARYFTLFTLGFIISQSQRLWQQLKSCRWLSLVIALCCYGLILFIRGRLPDSLSQTQYVLLYGLLSVNSWMWLCAVLGWGYAYLNRPFSWLAYATEAVYPWYILHQTVTVVAGFYLARWAWLQSHGAAVLEPILLVSITVISCLVIHEFVIRRTPWLRPLFGLSKRSRLAERQLQAQSDQLVLSAN